MSRLWRVVRGRGQAVAVLAIAGFLGMAAMVEESEARRLGGGKSFGRQSQNVQRQQSPPPAKDTAAQAAPGQAGQQGAAGQPQPAGSRWAGPLTGLAAGLGIAALLSALGLSGALAEMLGSILVIGLLALAGLFVWRMLRGASAAPAGPRRMEPAVEMPGSPQTQPMQRAAQLPGGASGRVPYDAGGPARPGSVLATLGAATTAEPEAGAPWGVPADFDTAGFLRNAKVHFYRLQAAWEAHDLDDIREFTSPEVFAELRMQLKEGAAATTGAEVLALEAHLLGIEENATDYVASVRFDGSIREGEAAAEQFSEVRNLSKPKRGNRGWLLAGVQQLQ